MVGAPVRWGCVRTEGSLLVSSHSLAGNQRVGRAALWRPTRQEAEGDGWLTASEEQTLLQQPARNWLLPPTRVSLRRDAGTLAPANSVTATSRCLHPGHRWVTHGVHSPRGLSDNACRVFGVLCRAAVVTAVMRCSRNSIPQGIWGPAFWSPCVTHSLCEFSLAVHPSQLSTFSVLQ